VSRKAACIYRADKQTRLCATLFISVARGLRACRICSERASRARARARGVTCYLGACRSQTHISRVPLSCRECRGHRQRTAELPAKGARPLLCLWRGMHSSPRRWAATAFNGTRRIATILRWWNPCSERGFQQSHDRRSVRGINPSRDESRIEAVADAGTRNPPAGGGTVHLARKQASLDRRRKQSRIDVSRELQFP